MSGTLMLCSTVETVPAPCLLNLSVFIGGRRCWERRVVGRAPAANQCELMAPHVRTKPQQLMSTIETDYAAFDCGHVTELCVQGRTEEARTGC